MRSVLSFSPEAEEDTRVRDGTHRCETSPDAQTPSWASIFSLQFFIFEPSNALYASPRLSLYTLCPVLLLYCVYLLRADVCAAGVEWAPTLRLRLRTGGYEERELEVRLLSL